MATIFLNFIEKEKIMTTNILHELDGLKSDLEDDEVAQNTLDRIAAHIIASETYISSLKYNAGILVDVINNFGNVSITDPLVEEAVQELINNGVLNV